MRRNRMTWIFLLGIGVANLAAAQPVQVFVSVLPQKYFVQQIGGDRIDVSVMVAPGASPHTYEPKPQQMAKLSAARVYFAVGISFEQTWLEKIAAVNPRMLIVHTEAGIERLPMTQDHDDGGLDPHIWLSPPLVKIQARHVLQGLTQVDPRGQVVYEANCERFAGEIDELDAELKRILSGKQGLQFMVFHPSWGYFAHAYGLEQVPIELEGKEPKPAQLKELIQHARERGIRHVLVQPQFSTRSAEVVARAIDGNVIAVDPLALDWANNLRSVARALQKAAR